MLQPDDIAGPESVTATAAPGAEPVASTVQHTMLDDTVAKHLPHAVWRLDREGRVVFANQAYLALHAVTLEQIAGRTLVEWSTRPEARRLRALDLQLMQDARSASAFDAFVHPVTGARLYFEVLRTPVHDRAGVVVGMQGVLIDLTERRLFEDALRAIARSSAARTPEAFFEPLLHYLAQTLHANLVCVTRLSADRTSAQTLCVLRDGQLVGNFSYPLKDAPCSEALGHDVRIFPSGVQARFPRFAMLAELGAQAHVGVTLWDRGGVPIGLLVAVSQRPVTDNAMVETMLKLVAVPAASEIERMDADADLRASEAVWKFALEGSGAGVWDWDPVRALGRYSPLYKTLLGYPGDLPDADLPRWESSLHPEDRDAALAALEALYTGATSTFVSEHRLACRDGSYKWMHERGMLVGRDDAGRPLRTVGTTTDISSRKQAEHKLRLAASVFTHTMEGIVITDADGTIIEVNDAFCRITGYARSEALGQTPRILSSGRQGPEFYAGMWGALRTAGQWSGEIWNRRKGGEVYAEILTISAVRNAAGVTTHYVALFTDITAHKEHERQLEHIAHFDALTGLPNRVLLGDRLQQAMLRCSRQERSLAVAFLDLDGFKNINDAYGHDVGDDFLISVGSRMKSVLRDGDSLARIGGDEFVAVLVDLDRPEACEPVLDRLLAAAAEPVVTGGATLRVSASIGVTIYPQDGVDADLLMRHADQAMYLAKQAGRNRWHLFDLAHDSAAKSHRESLEQIREAFALRQFVLYYQPKVNMRTGALIGAEALIRWRHPQRGVLPPASFLQTMENHPISLEVGDWVIATALAQMARWRAGGLELPVSVNIGARQLQQPGFSSRLAEQLAVHPDIPAHCLELEILETSALEDIAQVSEVMQSCRALGVRFALDDFGTGYSSLTYLKRLPADMIKIDQSFVRDMLEDTEDRAIVEGVVGLARVFRREVIAEGVETRAHGSLLLQLGCELAQGYGVARPMPADALTAWAARWRDTPDWQA